MNIQLIPTDDIVKELSRRYPSMIRGIEVPAQNLQPPQVVVFHNGQIHHVLGLVKYAEVTFSGMLGRSQRQIADGTF